MSLHIHMPIRFKMDTLFFQQCPLTTPSWSSTPLFVHHPMAWQILCPRRNFISPLTFHFYYRQLPTIFSSKTSYHNNCCHTTNIPDQWTEGKESKQEIRYSTKNTGKSIYLFPEYQWGPTDANIPDYTATSPSYRSYDDGYHW